MKSVDIILPNHDSSNTIVSTINSIFKQSYNNWHLIIVDDNSNQKTKRLLSQYIKRKKITIHYLEKNKGAAYCRNLAIKKSKSYYLAFIDSDDLWGKNKLKNQINFMQKNKYDFCYTWYKTFNAYNSKINNIKVPKTFNFESFIKNTSIATSSMIVKRSIADGIRFSNTKICEDYFYKCQLLKKIGNAYCYPGYLTRYRIRKKSLQSNRIRNIYWLWKINSKLNNFNILKNLISIFFISLNSIKKYGLR